MRPGQSAIPIVPLLIHLLLHVVPLLISLAAMSDSDENFIVGVPTLDDSSSDDEFVVGARLLRRGLPVGVRNRRRAAIS